MICQDAQVVNVEGPYWELRISLYATKTETLCGVMLPSTWIGKHVKIYLKPEPPIVHMTAKQNHILLRKGK
jgi:hypothetical protein